ncbi:hypothetical protein F2P56_033448 [Juglans regia]|uniref:Uncharacterized protein n=2 Tax=Juglans regia TaxID=51240 RepID=A0A833THB1_JUGRE|nr:uncharacterized protein LOC109001705 isoform X3 [Juglans regia]KAF5447936.1 hypothetical protein F2P56_033448 [Juglans regia]
MRKPILARLRSVVMGGKLNFQQVPGTRAEKDNEIQDATRRSFGSGSIPRWRSRGSGANEVLQGCNTVAFMVVVGSPRWQQSGVSSWATLACVGRGRRNKFGFWDLLV